MLILTSERRTVYTIYGDKRIWRYFTLHAALRRLAIRKLAKKYPATTEIDPYNYNRVEYESDISYERRMKITKRFIRRWKKIAKKNTTRLRLESMKDNLAA